MNTLAINLIVQLVFILLFLALFFFLKKQLKEESTTSLDARKEAIEGNIQSLEEQLDKYQKLVHDFEKDRAEKYGNIEAQLKNATQSTAELQKTTNRLNDILGNVKLRGQWGERMAEDIIRNSGLIEGVNYKKQKALGSTNTRPDYTFLLPDKHKINMDVKFPLDNYLNMVNSVSPSEKEQYQKEFVRNVKDRIKEIQNRDYINPAENTLDFVLLFIPNEQVYGLIQEKIPGLMDDALKQKVVLCSPFTLYAMLTVIRQAFENFRFEKDMKKIIQLIEQFAKVFEKFKGRFDNIGKALEKLESEYSDVKTKSFKQLDTKIRQIDDHKKGKNIAADSPSKLIDVSHETIDDEQLV